MTKFIVQTKFARRIPDPVFGTETQRHIMMVPVDKLPQGLPRDPNPRAPNIDRAVWRDIRDHLLNREGTPNTFHLKNKGITILATRVEALSEDKFAIEFEAGDGIVDGGHTYELITQNLDEIVRLQEQDTPVSQFVKLEVLTGVRPDLATELAGGLNTAIQVQSFSLENHKNSFGWIKSELAGKPYLSEIAFREGDDGAYDIRDILVLLDLFNVVEFPNDGSEYPVRTYFSKANVLANYVKNPERYEVLRPILADILTLHDEIQLVVRERHNESGGKFGNLAFVEKKATGEFPLHFIGTTTPYRLNRAALLPILGAFRWMVQLNEEKKIAEWTGGFETVHRVLDIAAPDLIRATQSTSDENKGKVHAIGRSRSHWENLHSIVTKRHLMMAMRR